MAKFIELEINGLLITINTDTIECVEPKKIGTKTVSTVFFTSKNAVIGYQSGTTTETYNEVVKKLL